MESVKIKMESGPARINKVPTAYELFMTDKSIRFNTGVRFKIWEHNSDKVKKKYEDKINSLMGAIRLIDLPDFLNDIATIENREWLRNKYDISLSFAYNDDFFEERIKEYSNQDKLSIDNKDIPDLIALLQYLIESKDKLTSRQKISNVMGDLEYIVSSPVTVNHPTKTPILLKIKDKIAKELAEYTLINNSFRQQGIF